VSYGKQTMNTDNYQSYIITHVLLKILGIKISEVW